MRPPEKIVTPQLGIAGLHLIYGFSTYQLYLTV